MTTVRLPDGDGATRVHTMRSPMAWETLEGPVRSRSVYAAAHVVADPESETTAGADAVLDWERTLAFRHHLWDHGLGVADAMDTAQRNGGLTWETTAELIRRVGAEARSRGAPLVCGIGTDHLAGPCSSLDEVTQAYLTQLEVAEQAQVVPVVMASRHLAALARHVDDYLEVYGRVLAESSAPVVLHWLGEEFDPHLAGYWASADLDEATSNVLALIENNAHKVDGIKVSLLEGDHETELRRRMPAGVKVYTGDDFNYPSRILGDDTGYSHALLGAFDAIAPVASAAFRRLDEGDEPGCRQLLDDTVALSRHLFASPTFNYKTGITFLAWLVGHQPGFVMVGGMASARSAMHLVRVFELADELGLFPEPELTARRLESFLTVTGLDR